MMRRGRQILAAILLLAVMCACTETTVLATEPDAAEQTEELSEEQKAEQAAYEMKVESNDWKNWPQGPGTYGEAAIVMEVGTGAILYAKNIDSPPTIGQHYQGADRPGSAGKRASAEDPVTFSHDSVAFLQPGDSSVGLKEGNQISLEQALHATLLASANEAAYAVGESVGINAGHDYSWFLEQMNTRCRELGGENSNFANTNGLHDENHYTCARDMALIGRELLSIRFFASSKTLNYTIPATETVEEHIFQQKHKMLMPENSNYYPYAIGGKTGFTSDALSTLITMADNGGMQLVCVVLRTHGVHIYPDTAGLFEYAFNNFSKVPVADYESSKDVGEILEDGSGNYVMLPQSVKFEDLDMELIPDGGTSSEATLQYTYEGNPVGSARCTLSDSYKDEHSAKVTAAKKEKKSKDDGQKKGKTKKMAVACASVVLAILIAMFISVITRRSRIRKRRRRR
ncbi:MAG: D-alanyl-D-alanine carboxypeptidase family protein [[Clostridium] scindens]